MKTNLDEEKINSDLVSVIIPVYNVKQYLNECVESIITQTYRNLEIILVDDGSSDGSEELCDLLATRDDRIMVIHQANKGLPGARNSGLKIADGKWILFVDSDDWLVENAVELLLQTVKGTPETEIVLFGLQRKQEYEKKQADVVAINSKKLSIEEILDLYHDAFDPMSERFHLLGEGKVPAWTKLYNSEFLKKNEIDFFEEVRIHEDVPFAALIYQKATHVTFLDAKLYMYRYNPNSIMNSYRPNYVKEMKDLMNRMRLIGKEHEDVEYAKLLLNNRVIATTVNLLIKCFCHKDNQNSYRERKKTYYEWVEFVDLIHILESTNTKEFQFKKRIATILLKINSFALMNVIYKFY